MDLGRKREAVVHIVPMTANYLSFLAFFVSVSYAAVFLMPRSSTVAGGKKVCEHVLLYL